MLLRFVLLRFVLLRLSDTIKTLVGVEPTWAGLQPAALPSGSSVDFDERLVRWSDKLVTELPA